MLCHQDPVQFHPSPAPVLETAFSLDKLQELLSFCSSTVTPKSSLVNPAVSPTSGSDGSDRISGSIDERKKRRMISNREYARRSRWRKKQHLDGLNEQLNRFTVENRELKNRLGQAMNRCHVVRRENERLRWECITLLARLSDLYQIFVKYSKINDRLN